MSNHTNRRNVEFKTIHVNDSQKTVQIRDAFNVLRYEVVLTSEELSQLNVKYEVTAVNYFSAPDPVTIFIGATSEYDEAMKMFDEAVVNYTCLVKAETKDYSDIEIFEKKIGYHKPCIRCCGTCKFGSRCIVHKPGDKTSNAMLRCTNADNVREYGFDVDVPAYAERKSHFIGELPERSEHDDCYKKPIEPKVSVFGICKRYFPDDAQHKEGFDR